MSSDNGIATPSSATRRLQSLSRSTGSASATASGRKSMSTRNPFSQSLSESKTKRSPSSTGIASTGNGLPKTPSSKSPAIRAASSPLREDRLYAENDLLGELVLRLREERDAERTGRIEAEQRAIEAETKLKEESLKADSNIRDATVMEIGAKREIEVREELEDLALDLQDQLHEYKQKAGRYDDLKRELEAERQNRMMMEEVVAASPEGGYIAVLKERCNEMENMVKNAERKVIAHQEEAKGARKDIAVLRDEAAKREALLEQEIEISRAAEEEEITRLRLRVRSLENKTKTNDNGDEENPMKNSRDISVPESLSQMDKPEASTEMHLHALALIRDRSRLLRRLHRAETDVMLLRAQCHKLESSLLSGGDVQRADALIKSARVVAQELGIAIPASMNASDLNADSIDTILKHVRPLFLSESLASDLELLPREALSGYASCLEDALVQSRADCVTLKRQSNESNSRETEMADMLKEATERESNSTEVR